MCEIPEFYDERFIVARKPHKCCETGRVIEKGEKYWRISGKWDGVVSTVAQSEAAFHFARWVNGVAEGGDLRKYDGESCIPFGEIRHELGSQDAVDEFREVCAGRLTRWTLAWPAPDHYRPMPKGEWTELSTSPKST